MEEWIQQGCSASDTGTQVLSKQRHKQRTPQAHLCPDSLLNQAKAVSPMIPPLSHVRTICPQGLSECGSMQSL